MQNIAKLTEEDLAPMKSIIKVILVSNHCLTMQKCALPVAIDSWNVADVLGSVEEDEGDMASFVVASNLVVEVDGWLWIMGLWEDDGLLDVDGLFSVDCSLNVDGCCLTPPSLKLYYYENLIRIL